MYFAYQFIKKHTTRPPTYTRHKNKLKVDNISCDTTKVLEENIGGKISDIHTAIFSPIHPSRAREINEKINNGTTSNKKASARLEKTSAK